MSKTRKTKVLVGNVTRDDAEDAFGEFAAADARLQRIQAEMDKQFVKIREKHADDLAALAEVKEQAFEKIQAFAEGNRDVFGKKKSLEMVHGMIGFRTGTPKLKTLKGFTWASVLNLLKVHLPDYIRTSEEPAKDRLLVDREKPEVQQQMSSIGLYVDQDEAFFVEPKKEAVEAAA